MLRSACEKTGHQNKMSAMKGKRILASCLQGAEGAGCALESYHKYFPLVTQHHSSKPEKMNAIFNMLHKR